jgi:hypothetical protein
MPNQPTPPDGPPYIIGQDFYLGERYDSDDMHRDYPELRGLWQFTQNELDGMGLQPGDQLGPGIIGPATDA